MMTLKRPCRETVCCVCVARAGVRLALRTTRDTRVERLFVVEFAQTHGAGERAVGWAGRVG